jgi:hypothetical protein
MGGTCISCGAPVSLSAQVQPIFTSTCATAGCHTGAHPQAGLTLGAGQSWSNLVNVRSGCSDGRLRVTAGETAHSYLINKLTGVGMCSGTRMPGGSAAPLNNAQMAAIRGWICEGAPNN